MNTDLEHLIQLPVWILESHVVELELSLQQFHVNHHKVESCYLDSLLLFSICLDFWLSNEEFAELS